MKKLCTFVTAYMKAYCYHSVPYGCDSIWFNKTGRPLAVRLREHTRRQNLKDSLLEKSKLAQNAYEQGHSLGWNEARIPKIEINSRYRN
jgi:hypothetical protein